MAPGRKSIDKARKLVFQGLSDLQSIGKTQVHVKELCTEAGYAGPDNQAFRAAIKELVCEQLITKPKGSSTVEVTKKTIDEGHMPKPKPPATNEDIQNQFWEKLINEDAAKAKMKGGFPKEDKLRLIYDRILDGNTHSKKYLCCEVAGYAAIDNKGFRNLMTRMKELGAIDIEKGDVTATDALFPRGRPTTDDGSGNVTNDDTNDEQEEEGDSGSPSSTKKRKRDDDDSDDDGDDDDDSSYEG